MRSDGGAMMKVRINNYCPAQTPAACRRIPRPLNRNPAPGLPGNNPRSLLINGCPGNTRQPGIGPSQPGCPARSKAQPAAHGQTAAARLAAPARKARRLLPGGSPVRPAQPAVINKTPINSAINQRKIPNRNCPGCPGPPGRWPNWWPNAPGCPTRCCPSPTI